MARAALQTALVALVVGLVAVLGYAAQAPWLVPSVGSSAFIQIFMPEQPAGRAYAAGVGQLVGMAAGFGAVLATGAASAPVMAEGHPIDPVRVGAVALAVLLTAAGQVPLRATSAAGAAVAVLIGAGVASTGWASLGVIAASIGLVTAFGEAGRRLLLAATRG